MVIGLGAGDHWVDDKPTDLDQLEAWWATPKGFVEGWGGPPTMLWEPGGRLWGRYGGARQSDFVLLDSDGTVLAPGGPMTFASVSATEGLLQYHLDSANP